MFGSCACTSTTKPKSVGRLPPMSCHDSAPSSVRITSQCFCMNSVFGREGCIAIRWTQWPTSASCSGIVLDFSPRFAGRHVLPASSVRKTPAAEMAMNIRSVLVGSMTMVCRQRPPAPGAQPLADSWVRRPGSSVHVLAPSVDLKKAASSTPAYTVSGSLSEGSRCQTRLNSQGCGDPSYQTCVPGVPSYLNSLPAASQVLPPSFERCSTWPNQPLDWDAYSRSGSAGEPLR